MNLEDHPDAVPEWAEAPELGFNGQLEPEQKAIEMEIKKKVELSLALRWPDENDIDAWQSWEMSRSQRSRERPLCLLGPAGSGKTTVVEVCIRRALGAGAHVGVACPTGILASAYRAKFPDLDVDTVHGMFGLHKAESETMEMMMSFDMVVIDEVGQLSMTQFERLLRLWDATERRVALIFVGDFHQLRGVDPSRANE
eukprot:10948966-Karenia_brevis.AAC.1